MHWWCSLLERLRLHTTKQYKITVTTTSNTADWVVSTVPCYPGGTAFVDGTPMTDQDFGFVTRGYNVTPPAPAPVTIAKPATLTAEYLGQTEGVKVDWSASSTADIAGYYVYRSESETTGFVKIDTVAKPTTEYIDHGIIEEITYYYQVRAYKGDVKSVASPTASVEVPTFVIAEETPVEDPNLVTTQEEDSAEDTNTTSKFVESISNYLIGGAFVLLAIILLVIFLVTRKKTPKGVKPDVKKVSTDEPPVKIEAIKPEVKKEEVIPEVKKIDEK